MPTPVDNLTGASSEEQIDTAISACIATEIRNGRPQAQAVAMCHSQAREKTGKELAPKNKRFPTMRG